MPGIKCPSLLFSVVLLQYRLKYASRNIVYVKGLRPICSQYNVRYQRQFFVRCLHCYGEVAASEYFPPVTDLWLSMKDNKWVSANASPHSELGFYLELGLKPAAHAMRTIHDRDLNPSSQGLQPSALPLSHLGILISGVMVSYYLCDCRSGSD